jgi:hypothetical protein
MNTCWDSLSIRGEGEVPMEVLLTACALRHGEARLARTRVWHEAAPPPSPRPTRPPPPPTPHSNPYEYMLGLFEDAFLYAPPPPIERPFHWASRLEDGEDGGGEDPGEGRQPGTAPVDAMLPAALLPGDLQRLRRAISAGEGLPALLARRPSQLRYRHRRQAIAGAAMHRSFDIVIDDNQRNSPQWWRCPRVHGVSVSQ